MGWFVISVLIPVLAPVALLTLYLLAPVHQEAQIKLITQVKDGQLSWAALGFCASALYELAEAAVPLAKSATNWSQGCVTFLLVVSAFIALLSVVYPTAVPLPPGGKWYRHFSMLVGSGVTVTVSAVAYTYVHFLVGS